MRLFFLLSLSILSVVSVAQDTTRLSLLFAGDIMGHDSQIAAAYNAKTGRYDYAPCFQFVKPYISMVDLAIGNLELTLAGPPYKGYPQFSSPDVLASTLKDIGFDALVTANNHSVDRGKKGIVRTIHILDSLNIPHTGTFVDEADRLNNYPLILRKNGFTLALLNYTYGTNGIPVPSPTIVNPIDTAMIRADIKKAKEQEPDAIIVFTHWGTEYENLPRKGERNTAEFCFAQGADLVIGSHPHVLQPMEWRKEDNKLVVYSLGNFVSGQRKRYTDGGAMAYVELKKVRDESGTITTTIDSAGYLLNWVYRTVDDDKDYYVMPVPSFEKETRFIKDVTSKTAMKEFISDSRLLYGKHNINVGEIKTTPPDSIVTYKVLLSVPEFKPGAASAIDSSLVTMIDPFYGLEILIQDNVEPTFIIGPFTDPLKADAICQQFIRNGRQALTVKYVNDEAKLETEEVIR